MSCQHRHSIFHTTVRKAPLKAVMLPVAQATLALNLSLGRKACILTREQQSTQTRGLPRETNDKSLKAERLLCDLGSPRTGLNPQEARLGRSRLCRRAAQASRGHEPSPSSEKVLLCLPRTHFPECSATWPNTVPCFLPQSSAFGWTSAALPAKVSS